MRDSAAGSAHFEVCLHWTHHVPGNGPPCMTGTVRQWMPPGAHACHRRDARTRAGIVLVERGAHRSTKGTTSSSKGCLQSPLHCTGTYHDGRVILAEHGRDLRQGRRSIARSKSGTRDTGFGGGPQTTCDAMTLLACTLLAEPAVCPHTTLLGLLPGVRCVRRRYAAEHWD